jgi:hypothetical protein
MLVHTRNKQQLAQRGATASPNLQSRSNGLKRLAASSSDERRSDKAHLFLQMKDVVSPYDLEDLDAC